MASAELNRRVETVLGYPPLSELRDLQRREFQEAMLDAAVVQRRLEVASSGKPGAITTATSDRS